MRAKFAKLIREETEQEISRKTNGEFFFFLQKALLQTLKDEEILTEEQFHQSITLLCRECRK